MDTITLNKSIDLAKFWQNRANEKISDFEKKFHKKMKKMLSNPVDKVLLIEIMDQSFRSKNNKRVANQMEYLFSKYTMATFFTSFEKFLIFLFRNFGIFIPDLSVPFFIKNIREEAKTVVLKGEEKHLNNHLQKRKKENITVNINLIGEIVLGEDEAKSRVQKYINALKNPNVTYLSIKLSTIFSQINSLAYEDTIKKLSDRLSQIYQEALKQDKFVNIDMEEYRDLSLTFDTFTKTLDKKEFRKLRAGIVLQAYLPNSHNYQKKLTKWAKQRVENGGVSVKIRLVKGANMEMEKTESVLKDWELATYTKKLDTDSNYKVMLEYALDIKNAPYVHIGVASHNLFELAYATQYAKKFRTEEYLTLEMLEGMSESVRVAISESESESEQSNGVILYAPSAKKDQFTNAIAYLVRRLDENTTEENFIRYSFGLRTDCNNWKMLQDSFIKSFENKDHIFIGDKRKQDRLNEDWINYEGGSYFSNKFQSQNETDFVLSQNQQWARNIKDKWMKTLESKIDIVPVVIANEDLTQNREIIEVLDKSQLKEKIICGKFAKASSQDLTKAVQIAKKDSDGWRELTNKQRHKILAKVANLVRQRRGDLIGIAAAELSKVFSETDVEVSEAVDFIEFYAHSARYFEGFEGFTFKGKGVGLVVSPWNFPIAIPLGGVASILASGNTCIIKPASIATLCAYEFCKCFWDAGVSKNTLQFAPCSGSVAKEYLIKNEGIDFVILTGGEDTAYNMLKSRPKLLLSAETGGKNATIITAMADKDQAIKNVIQSAFSNSGQKCSATSLLILEKEVYENKEFKEALVDAAKSLNVGSVWDFENKLSALANIASGDLKYAMDRLEDGEHWALKPEYVGKNPYMLKPAIKWGVKNGSFCHMKELFAPILSVMCADNLNDAINLVNKTGYGLTSGIESLDEREIKIWKKSIKAGNLYINRGTTGAIVLRQPFGGMGKSAIGAGRKVGTYNYITQFMEFKENSFHDSPKVNSDNNNIYIKIVDKFKTKNVQSEDIKKLKYAITSYIQNFQDEFSKEKDYFKLRGEDNIFRYISLDYIAIRVCSDDTVFEIFSRIFAAKISDVKICISIDNNETIYKLLELVSDELLKKNDSFIKQSNKEFIPTINKFERIIYSHSKKVPDEVFKESSKNAVFIPRMPAMMEGRIELLNYFKEQATSHSYHRYGNLGIRSL